MEVASPGLLRHSCIHLGDQVYVGKSAQGQVEVRISLDLTPVTVIVADAFFRSADRLHLADRVREAANIALTTWRDEIECAAAVLAQRLVPLFR